MSNFLLIALGAVAGAYARYCVALLLNRASSLVPYGTLLINITGSLLLGFFMVWTTERVLVDARWRLLVAVGFCGAYTTFSSYAYETFALWEQGRWVAGVANVALNNVVSLAAVLSGALLARAL
ncbi:MAG: fluoride efflux transporter CrcB [Terriglobales bacterium]